MVASFNTARPCAPIMPESRITETLGGDFRKGSRILMPFM
jgi:hypothetical protein